MNLTIPHLIVSFYTISSSIKKKILHKHCLHCHLTSPSYFDNRVIHFVRVYAHMDKITQKVNGNHFLINIGYLPSLAEDIRIYNIYRV